MYIFENLKYTNHLLKELKESKKINFINSFIDQINYKNAFVKFKNKKNYYDLIILCVGGKNIFYGWIYKI